MRQSEHRGRGRGVLVRRRGVGGSGSVALAFGRGVGSGRARGVRARVARSERPHLDERGAASLAEPVEVVLDVVTRPALHGEVTRAGRDDARAPVQAPHLSAREPGDVLANAHERVRGGAGVRERHGDAGETTDAGGPARGGGSLGEAVEVRAEVRTGGHRGGCSAGRRVDARRGHARGAARTRPGSSAARRRVGRVASPTRARCGFGATTRLSRLFSDEATFEI